MNQLKRVGEPALFGGFLQRNCRVAGAKVMVANMGMDHTVIARSRLRIERDYLETIDARALRQARPMKPNQERPQLGFVQHDGVGADGDGLFVCVNDNRVEFVVQRLQFGLKIRDSRRHFRRFTASLGHRHGGVTATTQCRGQASLLLLSREMPTVKPSLLHEASASQNLVNALFQSVPLGLLFDTDLGVPLLVNRK